MKRAVLFVLLIFTVVPLTLYGCGGGGGGLTGLGGGEVPVTVTGTVNNGAAPQGAPERLSAPLAGYVVTAVNAQTGETLPGATAFSDANGNFVLNFKISITQDKTIIIVARDPEDATGATMMRSILPLVATDIQTLVNQGQTTITVGAVSPTSEAAVKLVEAALGMPSGSMGKTSTTLTATQMNTEAMRGDRFVLVGVALSIEGQVSDDGGPVTPPPTPAITVNAGTAQEQVGFGAVVNLSGSAGNLPEGATPTYQWTQTAGPQVTLTGVDTLTPSFTTLNTTDGMAYLEAKYVEHGEHELPNRFGVRAMTYKDDTDLSYTFKLTVTAGEQSASGTVTLSTLEPSSGLPNAAAGTIVILEGLDQENYNWSMTFEPYEQGKTSSAALQYADAKYPTFLPDTAGTYTLTEAFSGNTINVYAGTWWGVGINNNGCSACHGPNGFASGLNSKFVSWAETGHGTKFTSHLTGARGGTYRDYCVKCHTVGYNVAPQAVNAGFDDLWHNPPGGKLPWEFPTVLEPANWTYMVSNYPELAGKANIQCENCHGPSGSPAHGTLQSNKANRISMKPEVCAVCHGNGTNHGRYQSWKKSSHGDYSLAISRGTSSHCGRCHLGQGYIKYQEQAKNGFPGNIIDPSTNKDATAAYMTSIGAGADTAVPQTCQTCHDPHSEANPRHLRVYNDTAMLPAGFKAEGVGKGAICMSCHNTRNGINRVKNADGTVVEDVPFLHEDSDPVGSVLTSYSAPHRPAQADVFMGHNAYFVSGTNISRHAAIEDTCVTCHMTLVPDYVNPTTGAGQGANHKFSITPEQVCSKCHGDGVTGAPLQTQVHNLLEQLGNVEAQYLMAKFQRIAADTNGVITVQIKGYPIVDPATEEIYDVLSPATDIDLTNIDHVFPIEPHGQQGFVLVFVTPVTFSYPDGTDVTVSEVEVRLGDFKQYDDPNNKAGTTSVVIPLTDPLVKAGWNYFLFEGEGTLGIHNPSFTLKALDATIAAMQNALNSLP